ncbi:hypothetical protein JK358_32745 [Nocardia sp. 2]|uniref:Pyridine nucleotide-disulfide oxidoreductase n=2 Tax=Nocardia acididurans TaxID=2802282 RepID=A0ABS1MF27_9NOCA|nr:hypothetical protein [Nocardia acididurans]
MGVTFAVIAAAMLALAGCSAVEKGVQAIEDAPKSDTARAKVGDCINVIKASTIDSETEPVACTDNRAVYQVAEVHDSKVECSADYTSYEETLGSGTLAYMCLAPNFKEGLCYSDSMLTGYKYVDCAASEASFKVLQRIDGQADGELCSADANQYFTLTKPPTTFCTGSPKS